MLTATPVIEPLKFESPLGMMVDNFFARNFFEIGIKLWWLSGPHRTLIREGLVVCIHTFTFCFFFKSNSNSSVWKSICHGKHRNIRIYSPPLSINVPADGPGGWTLDEFLIGWSVNIANCQALISYQSCILARCRSNLRWPHEKYSINNIICSNGDELLHFLNWRKKRSCETIRKTLLLMGNIPTTICTSKTICQQIVNIFNYKTKETIGYGKQYE